MILAGGCGGGGKSAEESGRPLDVWARDFCTATATWLDSSQARDAEYAHDWSEVSQGPNPNPSELGDLIVDLASDQIALTTEAVESVRAVGHPAVENGAEMSSALIDSLDQQRDVQVGFRDAARDLPVDDPDAFTKESEELFSLLDDYRRSLLLAGNPGILSEELRGALNAEPACTFLGA